MYAWTASARSTICGRAAFPRSWRQQRRTGSRVAPDPPEPPPHPDPPSDFSDRPLPLVGLADLPEVWSRLCDCRHPSSFHWGKAHRYRFDDPDGQFGVMYMGSEEGCAFIETAGESRDAHGRVRITLGDLRMRCFWRIRTARPFRLVDLRDP